MAVLNDALSFITVFVSCEEQHDRVLTAGHEIPHVLVACWRGPIIAAREES